MGTFLIFLLALLICALLIGWWYRTHARRRRLPLLHAFSDAATRKLADDERSAAEKYLGDLSRNQQLPASGASAAPVNLRLNEQSDTVFTVTRAITRYGITTDDLNKWRYFLDSVEVHLPPFWEQHINDENSVELIPTDSLPLVIALNGQTLKDYPQEARGFALEPTTATQASIRGEESEQVELLSIRPETTEEHALSRPDSLREAVLVVVAFLLFYCSLLSPEVFAPWLLIGGVLLLLAGVWGIYAPPRKTTLREIHCLRGMPKRWGLFGENNQEHINNISLGIIDLIYPRHWQPWITQDLGQQTDIDIYLSRHVVRQGRFLSLHDEVKNFPLQYWLRSAIIALGALLVVVMLWASVPLDMPFKFTLSWLKGAQTIEATTVAQLEKSHIRIGDTLRLKGSGMCNIHTPGAWTAKENLPFRPFDCSQIVWNDAPPLPLPESDIVTRATALMQTVQRQLHPESTDQSHVSPALRSAIQKSGMVLLDDFGDIVTKTNDLCSAKDDCIRLKNALVNLGNTHNWETLLKRANTGKLDGVNVLLRPVSAESLENLVTTSTAPFVSRETSRAAQALNSPAPGGFLIISDEGSSLVNQPWPTAGLYDFPAHQQWSELQRLAGMLMHTPFQAEGIVTNLYTDANGTQHVNLHRIPDRTGLWRYLGTTLLLLAMLGCMVYHSIQAIRRYQRHRQRQEEIQKYYENCLNPVLLSSPDTQE
ncbi:intracellular growth attenuator family protein [uncultured Klebsiella sp.]|uniref:intracellular growth attenuator family protein n=1 Tax=uncultured Klebsiella sp. TaxID=284011 RepID=UPI00280451C8|nr:intracellular growth attenuator family protein [uncultured Klebsiella sp.]